MTKLFDLGNNLYRADTALYGSRQGKLRDVIEFMVFSLGIDYSEIEYALVEMNKNDHDAADFGMFGTFIFSFNSSNERTG